MPKFDLSVKRIERLTNNQERGIITRTEFLNDFLIIVGADHDTAESAKLVDLLPRPHRDAVFARLRELQETDFVWRPVLIGPGFSENGVARIQSQLRRLAELLEV